MAPSTTMTPSELEAAAHRVAALFQENYWLPRSFDAVQDLLRAAGRAAQRGPTASASAGPAPAPASAETPAGPGRQQDRAAGPSEPEPEEQR